MYADSSAGRQARHVGVAAVVGSSEAEEWPRPASPAYEFTKRLIDVVVSALTVVLIAPLVLAIALLIKLDSPGPVLFRHRRVARIGKDDLPAAMGETSALPTFPCLKFRSMFADARERFPELYTYQFSPEELDSVPIKVIVARDPGARFAAGAGRPDLESFRDPRVTRVGRWLRRTSLDELPNFLNVLAGHMSLVGPRPDIAENVAYYARRHLKKLSVKPGITGLAQIMGRGKLSFNEINEYDVRYVETRSTWLDFEILLKTIPAVLSSEGAR